MWFISILFCVMDFDALPSTNDRVAIQPFGLHELKSGVGLHVHVCR